MSRDMLSQEEIDALLKPDDASSDGTSVDEGSITDVNKYLTAFEQDALGEIGNISFGSSATALSTLLGQKVDITTPTVSVIEVEQVSKEFPQPHVAVNVGYTSGFEGNNLLVIKTDDARIIADLMMGGDGHPDHSVELTEMHTSAVSEAMNQMMGAAATAMSTIFDDFVNISPPETKMLDFTNPDQTNMLPDSNILIKIAFRLLIGDLVDSYLMQLVPVSFAKNMVKRLTGGIDETESSAPAQEFNEPSYGSPSSSPEMHTPPNQDYGQPMAAHGQMPGPDMYGIPGQVPDYGQHYMPPGYPPPQYGYPPAGYPAPGYGYPAPGPNQHMGHAANVQAAQFSNFDQSSSQYAGEGNLGLLLDVPLQVTVELGRTKKQIKDILEFSQGSIIELDRLAGEPVDILVNNKLIAKGEVVIDENFGVRVTDIISQIERVEKLQ